ncbi:hypothetical protein EBR66_06655 [bacterium]|nr:hypothetical protein [bacterium]
MQINARYIFILLVCALPLSASAVVLSGNVKFFGSLTITGALSKGSGTFEIDHPLAPRTKLLIHSFVESPDAKNIYDGIAVLDSKGEARVHLPAYFYALNGDYRYLFFPLYEAMPKLYIKQEIDSTNTFVIAGGEAGGEVSWQVTGIRHDPYIKANPIIPEVRKGFNQPLKEGECLFGPLCK